MIDKNKIQEELTIEQVLDFLANFGGEPYIINGDTIVSKTICHHKKGEGSHKLYYYDNSKLFKCYTDCEHSSFDIFELTRRIFANQIGKNIGYFQAIKYILQYFNLSNDINFEGDLQNSLKDWQIFEKHSKIKEVIKKNKIELPYYKEDVLNSYPQYRIEAWEKDYIDFSEIKNYNIHYRPDNHSVLIPHYDISGGLIGIRERTLIKEEEEFGKYKPAIIQGKMYNHPLGINLYGLNKVKYNIQQMKVAIIAEGEKACLQHASMFGDESNICVACCGSHISPHQMKLLINLGVKEVIVALDKQFKTNGDSEWKKLTENLKGINKKYGSYLKISFLFDLESLLGYKESPWDRGKEIFLQLFNERRFIN